MSGGAQPLSSAFAALSGDAQLNGLTGDVASGVDDRSWVVHVRDSSRPGGKFVYQQQTENASRTGNGAEEGSGLVGGGSLSGMRGSRVSPPPGCNDVQSDASHSQFHLPGTSVSSSNLQQRAAEVKTFPYQHRTFSDFCMLAVRMFYDDSAVVLVDFLVNARRAFTEADIREKLRWKDNLLHQKLYFLERQLILQREQNFERGSKSPVYWRISPHVVVTVEWHYSKLISSLKVQVTQSEDLQEFECASCQTKHSTLDAAAGLLSLDDEHPLCRMCGKRLGMSNSEEAKSEIRYKEERALRQLSPLRVALDRLRHMEIPAFAPYTRADKNEEKRENEELASLN